MSPRPPRRHLAASIASIIAGIVIGWLAGAGREGKGGQGAGSNQGNANVSDRERRHQAAAGGQAGSRHDFASYTKRVERSTTHPEALQAVARMSREELQAILLEVPEPDLRAGFDWDDQMRGKVYASAAAELLRRDGLAAIDWAQASGQGGAWSKLLQALAGTDPATAKERSAAYFANGPHPTIWLGYHAVTGAATRSAADVIACLNLWKDISFENVTEYAPGFDFAAVVSHLGATKDSSDFGAMVRPLLAGWAAADPDAAGAAMLQGIKDQGVAQSIEWSEAAGHALDGRASLVGEDAAAKWLADIIKQVPGDRRERMVANLTDRYLSAARAQGLIAHLEDPERIALTVATESNYGAATDHLPTVHLLQAMPSQDLRMQTLQAIAGRTVRPGEGRGMSMKSLESLMVKLNLSEAEMQKVFESTGN